MQSAADILARLSGAKRVVIKIGSALLVDESGALRREWLSGVAKDVSRLREGGAQVLIVSSGAIALGRARLGLTQKTLSLGEKQACAAAGQALLTQSYEAALAPFGAVTAQALLTLMDTEDRARWLNARTALWALLELGAVPIINENDTVATDEIRYGDNDRLAARTAQMVGADVLVLLSDIDGLYTQDPRRDPNAKHLGVIDAITPAIKAMASGANSAAGVGTGGMATKILAAEIAMAAGCHMVITNGQTPQPISALLAGARASWFTAQTDAASARKQWISGGLRAGGTLTIDAGARDALRAGKSLLAAGVKAVSGTFLAGEAVTICFDGEIIAKGLMAYSAADTQQILGLKSSEIEQRLGYTHGAALIHRDNLALVEQK